MAKSGHGLASGLLIVAVAVLVAGISAPAQAYLRKVANVPFFAEGNRFTAPPVPDASGFASITAAIDYVCHAHLPNYLSAWPAFAAAADAGIQANPYIVNNYRFFSVECTTASGHAPLDAGVAPRPTCDAPWFQADVNSTECRMSCPADTTEYKGDGTVNASPGSVVGSECRPANGSSNFGRIGAGGLIYTKASVCNARNNPCDPATGMKFQPEQVYQGTAGVLPIRYSLQYRSRRQDDPFDAWRGVHGFGWISPFERRLKFYDPVVNPGSGSYGVKRPDGREFEFKAPASGNAYVGNPDVPDRLERLVDAGGATTGWKYTSADNDEIETYDAGGLFLQVANRAGARTTLTYSSGASNDTGVSRYPASAPVCSLVHPALTLGRVLAAGRLLCVTDPNGRQVNFQYDQLTGTRIVALIDPAGGLYQFEYDGVSGGCTTPGATAPACTAGNLTKVTFPDGPARVYHYNESANINGGAACSGLPNGLLNHLTGIADENGDGFASYSYDCLGRATGTQHAGGVETATFTYNSDGTTTVTEYVGNPGASTTTQRKYSFQNTLGVSRTGSIVDPATGQPAPCAGCGSTASSIYDANGNVASRTDWNGNRTNYGYDPARNLETSRIEGLTSSGAATAATRTIETAWHGTYRLPTQVVEKNSAGTALRTTGMTYDASGNLLARTVTDNPSGNSRTWTYTYNAFGQALTVDGPRTDASDVTTYTYAASCTGCAGDLQSITNALGHTTSITSYNAHGQPSSIADPNGSVTTLTYDARQRLTSRSVGGETTAYAYDGVGQLTRVTLPDGSFLEYGYDAAHRLTGIADNLGNRIAYGLDLMGNRTQEQVFDPANVLAQTRSRVYNSLNRLAQEIGAQGQTTAYGYDNQGNLTSIDGPLAGAVDVTTNTYDGLNRLIRVTAPDGAQANYGLNALDQTVSVSDPRNLTTTYAVNGLGNLNTQVSPDTGSTASTYDAAGNVLTKTDARGVTATYSYDALNRVTQIVYPAVGGVAAQTVTFTYDQGTNGKGRMTTMLDRSGTTDWQYDGHGRVTRKQQVTVVFAVAPTAVTEYAYDAQSGRMTSMTYPSGRKIDYTYDAAGRVLGLALNGQPILSNIQYHPFGQPKSWTYGNGQAFSRTFDADGRIASHTLGADTRTITYDPASRITGMTHNDPMLNQSFGYDNRDRVTSWSAATTSQSYGYDANGNRTSHMIGANAYTHSVAANSNRLTSISGPTAKSYTYDAAGNLTAAGTVNITYGGDGRPATLASISIASNGLGQRVAWLMYTPTGNVLTFDESGRVLGEYLPFLNRAETETVYLGSIPVAVLRPPQELRDSDSGGNLIVITGTWPLSTSGVGYSGSRYLTHATGTGSASVRWRFWYSGGTPAAGSYNVFARWAAGPDRASNATYTITHTGGTSAVIANQQVNGGEWVALGTYTFAQNQAHGVVLTDQANGLVVADAIKYEIANVPFYTYYLHPDHLNTPRVVTDSANQMRWRWDTADPFGALWPTYVLGGVTFTMNDRFPGQYAEPFSWTGIVYNYYRDYDPATGRYIQSDPIGLEGGLNTYAYVNGNPISYTDPSGLEPGDLGQRGYKDLNSRTGPVDQTGRTPRSNPIEGPFSGKESTADKIADKILDQLFKQATGLGGLASRSKGALGIGGMIHSEPAGECSTMACQEDRRGICGPRYHLGF